MIGESEMQSDKKNKFIPILISTFIIIVLIFMPNEFSQITYPNSESAAARVLEVDNSMVKSSGIIKHGEQVCTVKILQGKFKNQISVGTNLLVGKLELDKIFVPGDKIFVVIDYEGNSIRYVNIIDHYRLDYEIILAFIFFLILILFAKGIGIRAILSFTMTVLMIWKVLIPVLLKGYDPIIVSFFVTITITTLIIMLVYGPDRRSLAAILGSLCGTLVTCIMAVLFVSKFKIHGAIMAYSESLLYSGYQNINLTSIFTACIFIASSGALMDLAVDITSAVHEVMLKNPNLSKSEAIKSGLNVGRSVIGTMTTTLLLAYSGGYMALLMVFMAQGTPLLNILNLKYVSSEILHTIIGSFGLITVAPFTALTSGLLLGKKKTNDNISLHEANKIN